MLVVGETVMDFNGVSSSVESFTNLKHPPPLLSISPGDKFRAALKARILLYEDISHRALVPGHEILGHIEYQLSDYDKSALHLNAAKEICMGHLKLLEEEGVMSTSEMEEKEALLVIVARVNEGLARVEQCKSLGVESTEELDMDIVDAIVEDLSRYDELNMQMSRKRSMEIESIAEEEEEGGVGGDGEGNVAMVDKLPSMEEEGSKQAKGMKFSEHRLRMTYISKSQGK